MAIVGIIAIVLLAVVVLIALGLVVRSIPDIRRYKKMRSM